MVLCFSRIWGTRELIVIAIVIILVPGTFYSLINLVGLGGKGSCRKKMVLTFLPSEGERAGSGLLSDLTQQICTFF